MKELTKESLEEFVKHELINKSIIVDKSEVEDTTSLYNTLNIDSLDLVEIGMEIEKEFNVSLPDEALELTDEKTFGEFIDAVLKSQE